ncbi:glycine betaine ABC transporter substrate-binding protein [Alkalicoccobacillus plakortidis]|uniref:Glycine/betaine ABC transporter substrate-binding protein n=1 Tax=Alkalicoccobacillus plakortidis TaxID=444060 RepID=A0ABT0XP16_9BACI|nr:glycine betaine ABC transporter substrate-binding protein [Alkalicoccobacillus plakortidis]MCM2677007.1 glycine/betaine ABC transporter substrate-binding protein [Alkalicoccobacillus plakortidis]
MKRLFGSLHITLALFIVLSGCSVFGAGSNQLTLGAKTFTEQQLLSEMTFHLLENEGYNVRQMSNLGSNVVRTALENGQVDLYWEYTGTALVSYMGEDPIADPDDAFAEVKRLDKENGIDWINVSDVNNTYTLLMRQEEADELGIETLSDLADYVNENPNTLSFGTDGEFANRPDGLPSVEETYDFAFGAGQLRQMDAGLIYEALYNEELNVGLGYETDPRIDQYDLIPLEDDQSVFPPYNVAVTINEDVLTEHPDIEVLTKELADKLDIEIMRQLNYEVDVEGQSVSIVAYNWLVENGLLEED